MVFVVRKGNPKHITGWSELHPSRASSVVTPNPATSGSARWNILAGYGAMLKQGKSPAQALAYVKTLITKNVSDEPSSASTRWRTFTSGKGDVLLDYESDAIAAERAGDKVSYVIPKQTILIQTPIAVTTKSKHAPQAKAFLKYQWSTAGQTIWAQQGYRPVDPAVAKQFATQFPTPPQLFTIGYLGGWTKVPACSSTRARARSPRSSRKRGSPLPPASAYAETAAGQSPAPAAPAPSGPGARARAPRGAGPAAAWAGRGDALPERHRADPAGRGRRSRRSRRAVGAVVVDLQRRGGQGAGDDAAGRAA